MQCAKKSPSSIFPRKFASVWPIPPPPQLERGVCDEHMCVSVSVCIRVTSSAAPTIYRQPRGDLPTNPPKPNHPFASSYPSSNSLQKLILLPMLRLLRNFMALHAVVKFPDKLINYTVKLHGLQKKDDPGSKRPEGPGPKKLNDPGSRKTDDPESRKPGISVS
jgi:hypothetical protein